jgi:spermidine synthase
MNTTFHWRAHVTNLLSRQFMDLVAARLAPGGLFAFNATGSPDVLATAAASFEHAYRWSNFVYAAHHDFRPGRTDAGAAGRIAALRLEDRPLLALDHPTDRQAIDRLLAQEFVTLAEAASAARRPLEVIDDMAMQTEFRHGRGMRFD